MSAGNNTFCGGGRGFFDRTDVEPGGNYDWHDLFDFSTCFEESIVTSVPAMFIVLAGLVSAHTSTNSRGHPSAYLAPTITSPPNEQTPACVA